MIRTIAMIGLLALAAGGAARADQNKATKAAPAAKGGVPKGGALKKGAPITNPNSLASQLYQLTPGERERALEKLRPEQQDRIRKNLQWFDGLPKDQQQVIIKRVERFAAMPPEERRAVQQQFQALNHLEPERRRAVGTALRVLQGLPDEQRLERLNRPAFRSRFSPEELRIIEKLSEVMPPPM